jgi:hypothetical protein
MSRAKAPPKRQQRNRGRLNGYLTSRNQIKTPIAGKAEIKIRSNRIHSPLIELHSLELRSLFDLMCGHTPAQCIGYHIE